jgi:hypothetical protein
VTSLDSKIVTENTQRFDLFTLVELKHLENLELLWRGSRDGFDGPKFHSKCDGKPNTLTVIKATTGYIFGGYTSVAWSSINAFKLDNTAFLYSFTNPANHPSLMRINTPFTNAVHHHPSYGPRFGTLPDLFIDNSSNKNKGSYISPSSYFFPSDIHDPEVGRFIHGDSTKYFQTVEIEVFQIV